MNSERMPLPPLDRTSASSVEPLGAALSWVEGPERVGRRQRCPYLHLAVLLLLLAACGCGPKPPKTPIEHPPSAETGRQGRGVYYTVRRGETLIEIANMYHVNASNIMQANGLHDQYSIYVGQKLLIPGAKPAVMSSLGRMPDLSNIVSESNFVWPLRGRVIRRFSPNGSETEHSRSIVIEARQGQPVVAAMSGVVTLADNAVRGYGKTIIIRHAGNVSTWYAYNFRLLVAQGDKVKQGQPIAEAGESGRATSAQLLFKICVGSEPVDPMRYLP